MLNAHTSRSSEQGFTLVELAIVMVIIGLLIGGILKGQELIANAKVSSSVSQLKGLDAAINTFYDKYGALPGDIKLATTRIPNCGGCSNGDQNSSIGTSLALPAATGEGAQVFRHMSAADLLSGIDGETNDLSFGKILPAVKAGGGMWIGVASAAPAGTTLNNNKHYAVLNGAPVAVSGSSGVLSANTAAQIDRKLDDGQPGTGTVQTTGDNCTAGTPLAYDEASTTSTCAMYVRVVN